MAKKSILIVEDEEDILELVRYNLTKEGYDVNGVSSGEDALKVIKSLSDKKSLNCHPEFISGSQGLAIPKQVRNDATISNCRIGSKSGQISPDLVILDLMLPGLDGLEVCKFLKNNPATQYIPIIMLTAKGEESDIVAGLEVGADDYITKPFSPKVLIARIRTIFRREIREVIKESTIKIDDLTINSDKYEVLIKDQAIKLTNNEFHALFLLAGQRGWVFTRNQIINAVSGDEHDVTDRSIDVLIVGLRKKLGNYAEYIETVHGIGYRFKG